MVSFYSVDKLALLILQPKFQHCEHKRSLLDPGLSQFSPVETTKTYFLSITFNIIHLRRVSGSVILSLFILTSDRSLCTAHSNLDTSRTPKFSVLCLASIIRDRIFFVARVFLCRLTVINILAPWYETVYRNHMKERNMRLFQHLHTVDGTKTDDVSLELINNNRNFLNWFS